jgi:hypothetical protein
MQAALISYNTFVNGETNGWKSRGDNRVLLLQNGENQQWGIPQAGDLATWMKAVKDQVDPLWVQLLGELRAIDMVVMYVGTYGAEQIIDLAADNGLSAERAAFVLCDCNMGRKTAIIRKRGFAQAPTFMSECGGHSTMRELYRGLLRTGRLPV